MEFYIGGYAQGKLAYVLRKYQGQEIEVVDGAYDRDIIEKIYTVGYKHNDVYDKTDKYNEAHRYTYEYTEKGIILNHLHLWVRHLLESGENPEQCLKDFIAAYPDCIIISDEVGNGIVPMGREEREYRERLGRIQIELAEKAERVERVICGLGQRLK